MLGNILYRGDAGGTIDQVARDLADLAKSRFIEARDHGAVGDGVSDDSVALNAAFQEAAREGKPLWLEPRADYRCTGTIAPGGTVTVHCNDATLTFDKGGTYSEVKRVDGSSFSPAVHVALDINNFSGSRLIGKLQLRQAAAVPDLSLASRANIRADLVAMCPSDLSQNGGNPGQWSFDDLVITKFGYGWFAPDSGPNTARAYNGIWGAMLTMRFVINPIIWGNGGNVADDHYLGVVRIMGYTGAVDIVGTELNVGDVFIKGMWEGRDEEPETVTATAGDPVITLSADRSADLAVGDYIGFAGGRTSHDGTSCWHVSRINAISGADVTLAEAPDNSVTDAAMMAQLPTFTVEFGTMNVVRLYLEHYFGIIRVGKWGTANITELKVSTGYFTSRFGCAFTLNRQSAAVNIQGMSGLIPLHGRYLNGVIGLAAIKSTDGDPVARHVIVNTSHRPLDTLDIVKMIWPVPNDLYKAATGEASADAAEPSPDDVITINGVPRALRELPTTDPGDGATIWNDGGTLKLASPA